MSAYAAAADDAHGAPAAPMVAFEDRRLDRLTAMLVHTAGADAGGISMVHRDRIWMPSHVGPFGALLRRSGSFCASALAAQQDWFEVEDARADARFAANPLVTAAPGYRHYAAVPIWMDNIQLKGTVWVMWHAPGRLGAAQRESLRLLAELAVETLSLRYCDEVSGIVNRTFFIHGLQQMLETSGRDVTVGYVNLRSFARLNGAYGQAAGDALLAALGGRLVEWGGGEALIAHLGGDRFGFALGGDADDTAARLAALHPLLESPLRLPGGRSVGARARVGLRVARAAAAEHAAVLLQEAAAAAASLGVAASRTYDAVAQTESLLLMELNELLAERPGHGRLEVHYEPQVDLGGGRLTGMEALVRWRHPVEGLLLPGEFIGLAEKSGKILALDMLVLRQVCRDVCAWREAGVATVPVALNFARESLLAEAMPAMLAHELARFGLDGRQFECEITESQCVDALGLQACLSRLRALGLRVAIDDFGTGYSNLETIRQLSFDKLKVDRQFVHGVADDARLAGLIRMIVNLAALFGAEVLCEGVERERDLRWLRAHGIARFQGWYFSAPLHGAPATQALARLAHPAAPLGHEELHAQMQSLQRLPA